MRRARPSSGRTLLPFTQRRFASLPMISIKVKGGSVNILKEIYYQTASLWCGTCPICQSRYQHYGTYLRKTPYFLGPIFIQRVYCENCKKSHALLPCFIIPYSRVLDVVREAAIVGICFNTQTMEELAELMEVDTTTIARWWKIFRTKSSVLMSFLTEKLAQSSKLSGWASGFFQTSHEESKKIFRLIYRSLELFSKDFSFCGFAWVNLHNPYLLFKHKGTTD